jgi:hypothetical protein
LWVLLAASATVLTAGCATTSPPLPDESQLLAAGFKVMVARTPEQQQHLQSLPAGKVTEWQRTGKHFFIYADAAKNRIYVGTPKEYEAYLRLVPGAASPSLAQQQAADIASYNRQDAAMQMYTTRDLADPYYFWDSFDGLGFR